MSRRARPYDNAQTESFMKTLKVEDDYLMECETFDDVATGLPRFIEAYNNCPCKLRPAGVHSTSRSVLVQIRHLTSPDRARRREAPARSSTSSRFVQPVPQWMHSKTA